MTLLSEARTAGLMVKAEGGRLVVRGPRRSEAIARRLIEHKAAVLTALACDTAALEAEDDPMPDLSRILPRPHELTPTQRRLWRERTAAYLADGMARPAAEQEAMAELVMTGTLFDPAKCFAWP